MIDLWLLSGSLGVTIGAGVMTMNLTQSLVISRGLGSEVAPLLFCWK